MSNSLPSVIRLPCHRVLPIARRLFIASLSSASLLCTSSVGSASICVEHCEEVLLYRSAESTLSFSLYRSSQTHSGVANHRWLHNYQYVLTTDAHQIIVFDPSAQTHVFESDASNLHTPASGNHGALRQTGSRFYWTDPSGDQYLFHGSQLSEIVSSYGDTIKLSYEHGRLHSVQDDSGARITLNYESQRLSSIQLPDGAISSIDLPVEGFTNRQQHECTPDAVINPEEELNDPNHGNTAEEFPEPATVPETLHDDPEPEATCDVAQQSPHTFHPVTSTSITFSQLDARPASCQSYFVEYYGTLRGFEIEAGLSYHFPYSEMESTIRTFPVIDFVHGDELFVVHSRDLGSDSYDPVQHPDALLDALLEDGREIEENFLQPINEQGHLSASELGQSTTILAEDVGSITLQLIIRDGMASADHWRQIREAQDQLQQQYGITLEIVIIP